MRNIAAARKQRAISHRRGAIGPDSRTMSGHRGCWAVMAQHTVAAGKPSEVPKIVMTGARSNRIQLRTTACSDRL